LPGADTLSLEQAIAVVFDRFWGMSMRDLRNVRPGDVHDIGHRVRDIMVEMPFQVPNDLLMLVRAVAILSGMCTGLDPNFNLWKQLEPYARKIVAEETGSAFSIDSVIDQVGDILRVLVALPSQTSRVLMQMEQGKLVIQSPMLQREMRHLGQSVDRLFGGMIFAAFLLGGVMLINTGKIILGEVFLGVSVLILLVVFLYRRGRD